MIKRKGNPTDTNKLKKLKKLNQMSLLDIIQLCLLHLVFSNDKPLRRYQNDKIVGCVSFWTICPISLDQYKKYKKNNQMSRVVQLGITGELKVVNVEKLMRLLKEHGYFPQDGSVTSIINDDGKRQATNPTVAKMERNFYSWLADLLKEHLSEFHGFYTPRQKDIVHMEVVLTDKNFVNHFNYGGPTRRPPNSSPIRGPYHVDGSKLSIKWVV